MKCNCSTCRKENNKDNTEMEKALIKVDITKVGCKGESEVTIEGTGDMLQNGLIALFNGLKKSSDGMLILVSALMEVVLDE